MVVSFAPATNDRYHLKTLYYCCIACILQQRWNTYLLASRLVGSVNRYRRRRLLLFTSLLFYQQNHYYRTASLSCLPSQRDTNNNNNNTNTILPTDAASRRLLWDPGISDAGWDRRVKKHVLCCCWSSQGKPSPGTTTLDKQSTTQPSLAVAPVKACSIILSIEEPNTRPLPAAKPTVNISKQRFQCTDKYKGCQVLVLVVESLNPLTQTSNRCRLREERIEDTRPPLSWYTTRDSSCRCRCRAANNTSASSCCRVKLLTHAPQLGCIFL